MYVCREQQQQRVEDDSDRPADGPPGGRKSTKAIKNIAQALARIRELEDEIAKSKVS